MTDPWFTDHDVTLYNGDAAETLRTLEAGSVNCIVTSPPYFGLRDYGTEGQIGLEPSPFGYVTALADVFAQAWRVLRDDGVLWLNLGDSYYSGKGSPGPNGADGKQPARRGWQRPLDRPGQDWGTRKSLLMMPEQVVFALLEDGWVLRNKIAWRKPNAMPVPYDDRLTNVWEYIFLLTKSQDYWFDLDPIRETHSERTLRDFADGKSNGKAYGNAKNRDNNWQPNNTTRRIDPRGKNPGDVWEIAATPYPDAHFATFPIALPLRCILASCPERVCKECGHASARVPTERGLDMTRPQARRAVELFEAKELTSEHLDAIRSAGASDAGKAAAVQTGTGRNSPRVAELAAEAKAALGGYYREFLLMRPTAFTWTDCGHDAWEPGVVLDPFAGSGTTLAAARQLGRKSVGIELNPDYCDLAVKRIGDPVFDFAPSVGSS